MSTFTFTITPAPAVTAPSPASRADPLGYDAKFGTDLEPSGRAASGIELGLDEILHRLMEDTLLMTGAPNDEIPFGEDVRKWAGAALSQASLEARLPRIEVALRRSPRLADVILSARVAAGDTPADVAFYLDIAARFVTGQLVTRVIAVSAVTVEYLAQG